MTPQSLRVNNKRASVEQSSIGYVVNFYIDDRPFHKTVVQSIYEAEEIMGQFLSESSTSSPQFLKESY
jgi:hypothetical protein